MAERLTGGLLSEAVNKGFVTNMEELMPAADLSANAIRRQGLSWSFLDVSGLLLVSANTTKLEADLLWPRRPVAAAAALRPQ